jgi:hypothetical protein
MMTTKVFSKCPCIKTDGEELFAVLVIRHLEKIYTLSSGPKLFQNLRNAGKLIRIVKANTESNSCTPANEQRLPLLVHALNFNRPEQFQTELKVALDTAKKKGIPPDFFAKQLTEGTTPVTYYAAQNYTKLKSPVTAPIHMSGAQVMTFHANVAMKNLGYLLDFAEGRLKLSDLSYFPGWESDLPRLLRPFLTPGRGCNSTVNYDPSNFKSCSLNPAMKNRNPLLSLAHELIHALHNGTGRNMRVFTNKQNLEEIITTGLPPYNSEELSDNKFVAELGPNTMLRYEY